MHIVNAFMPVLEAFLDGENPRQTGGRSRRNASRASQLRDAPL
jgi:hypothetical protein